MTPFSAFSAFSNPLSGPGLPVAGEPGSTAWRALLALAVVFVLLMTTGWTAVRQDDSPPGPYDAAVLKWEQGSIGGRELPSPDASPGTLARFFDTLDSAEQQQLAKRYPLVVGNLSGAPVQLRYEANKAALTEARQVEHKRMEDDRLTEEGRRAAEHRADRFNAMLKPDRQILAFDPTGDGRAAEVFGDLGHAQRVSVVVPGVDTNLLTFQKTARYYSAPVGMARSLHEQQQKTASDVRSATVAWADYTAPEGLGVDAASGDLAEEGADRLNDFVAGLPGSSRTSVSLFCHSYGSVVCGDAAGDLPKRVSDIAVAGSPGMGADSAEELDTDARVWAMRDGDDWISDVPHLNFGELGHGTDPISSGFGARRPSATDAVGHTGYFVPGTNSLRNLAAIGTGAYGDIECAPSDPECAADSDARA